MRALTLIKGISAFTANFLTMAPTLSSAYTLGPSCFGSYGFGRLMRNSEYFVAQRSVRDLESNGARIFHDLMFLVLVLVLVLGDQLCPCL